MHLFSQQDERNYCVAESTDLRFLLSRLHYEFPLAMSGTQTKESLLTYRPTATFYLTKNIISACFETGESWGW
jgi:hypothetical protein